MREEIKKDLTIKLDRTTLVEVRGRICNVLLMNPQVMFQLFQMRLMKAKWN